MNLSKVFVINCCPSLLSPCCLSSDDRQIQPNIQIDNFPFSVVRKVKFRFAMFALELLMPKDLQGQPLGPLRGQKKHLRGLQQEVQVCSFSEVHFSQLFLDLCEDSRDHIFGPNTKYHTILESLRQVCFSPKELIDLRGQLRPPANFKPKLWVQL